MQDDCDVGYYSYTSSGCSFDHPANLHNAAAHHSCSSLTFLESSLKQAQKVQDHFGKYVDKKKHKMPSQAPRKLPPTTESHASVQNNFVTNIFHISDSRVNMDSKG